MTYCAVDEPVEVALTLLSVITTFITCKFLPVQVVPS